MYVASVRIFIHFINSIEVSGAEVIEVSGARAIEISGASEVFGAMESVAPRHFKLLKICMAPEDGSRGIIFHTILRCGWLQDIINYYH